MRRYVMIKKLSMFAILTALSSVLACGELGKVDQGRVIEFDRGKGTVTIIRDKKADTKNPDYSYLPPVTYEMPKDPAEIGALPKAGKRMKLDTKKNQIVIFDTATQNFKTITYKLIEQKENVGKEDTLVYDKAADKPRNFPVMDREKKTITVYSKRQKVLTTFSLPTEYFTLPDNTWDSGDEARIYYKEEGKARRFMNVSKIDIFKK
ncbi:MAG: DUF4881 domain-containing protein [Desulfobacterales bacterium]|nr:DUF4881 domain-containing protein [Desulfobacterales bacterium]